MTRVLVTGSSGFIGRHVLAPLRALGFEVHVVLRRREMPEISGVVQHEADLFDRDAVRHAIQAAGASHLLHLAWDTEPGKFWRSPANLDWTAASLHLVRDFVEAGGTRVVGAGTCAEYAWGDERFVEDRTPCQPGTLYGASKDALRRILASYADANAISFAWGRVFFLYGPNEKPGRLVGDAVKALLSGERFPGSHGRQRRDFLHVTDVGAAFAALVASNVTGAVNIGSGEAVTVASLLNEVARQTGRADLLELGARPLPASEPDVVEADVARLFGEVGFRPRFGIETGIADVVANVG